MEDIYANAWNTLDLNFGILEARNLVVRAKGQGSTRVPIETSPLFYYSRVQKSEEASPWPKHPLEGFQATIELT